MLAEYDRAHPAPETIAADPANERVTWQEARGWWPYPNLVRLGSGLKPGFREEVVASSESGGRRGDPRSEYAFVVGYYSYGDRNISNSRALGINEAGGIVFQNFIWPAGTTPAPVTPSGSGSKIITVRGRAALLVERRPPDSNVHLTTIRWQQPSGDGGVLEWRLECDPRHWTEEQLVRLLDSATTL